MRLECVYDAEEYLQDLWFHHEFILASLRGRGIPFHDAEDAFQEAAMRVLHMWDPTWLPDNDLAWFTSIAMNCARNIMRDRIVRSKRTGSITPCETVEEDVLGAIISSEELENIRSKIEMLPKKQRLILRHIVLKEDTIEDDDRRVLQLGAGAQRALKYRAITNLRRMLTTGNLDDHAHGMTS